jgi:aspartate aminotransferase/aminotransferase
MLAGPKNVIDKMITLQQYTFVCPPSIAQYGILGDLKVDKRVIKEYKSRAKLVYDTLKSHFELEKPRGAFYAYVKAPIKSSKFVEKCIKNKVLIIPGNVFSKSDTHFRISFATSKLNLEKGLKKIIEVKNNLIIN